MDELIIGDDPEFNMKDNKVVQSVPHDFNNTLFPEEIEELEYKTWNVVQLKS